MTPPGNTERAQTDRWGQEVSGESSSVAAWDQAWGQFLHFRGDPIAVLASANADDDGFVLGPAFSALYAVLGGSALDVTAVTEQADRARRRAGTCLDREAAHVEALAQLVAGDFTAAGDRWDGIARSEPDFAAVRFAHDVFLHVGDADRRLRSSEAAVESWGTGAGASFIAGQHAFALEELGRYREAEQVGRVALDADPDDLWARHALAHVYESTDDNDAALELLEGSVERWRHQDLLATHIWWHLALRLLALGNVSRVLAIFDECLPAATTAFRLCDQSSLLWRMELAGHDVGDRWGALADRWDDIAERHTCAFLDLHAAITYLRCPDHPGAPRWFGGLDGRPSGGSELDEIFDEVAKPLVAAFRARAEGDNDTFVATIDRLGAATARIGGSVAQRDLISLTRTATGACE